MGVRYVRRQMNEWISVTERLPPSYQYCLVCESGGAIGESSPISLARYETDHWALLFEGENNACACGDLTWSIEAKDISHWMSIPEVPK